jgi:dephospho-CoA kinase
MFILSPDIYHIRLSHPMWLRWIIVGRHVNNPGYSIVAEFVFNVIIIFPICIVYGNCEKRWLVRSKQPIKYIKMYRIFGWSLLQLLVLGYLFDQRIVLLNKTSMSQQSMNNLLLKLVRQFFILIGIYVGQSFCPIAITGSIATGKSTFVKMLLEKNSSTEGSIAGDKSNIQREGKVFRILDLDKIGHDILLSPSRLSSKHDTGIPRVVHPKNSVFLKILQIFGEKDIDNKNVLDEDGEIDRRKLGDIVFQDPTKRRALNRITHPRISSIMMQQLWIGSYFHSKSFICADIPLLYETRKVQWLFPCVIVVACSPTLQYQRLRKRNPDLSEDQCRQRIASQLPIEQKVARADIVVWNNGTLEDLIGNVNNAKIKLLRRMCHGDFTWNEYLLILGGFFMFSFVKKL